jgi:rhomboid protease GluP
MGRNLAECRISCYRLRAQNNMSPMAAIIPVGSQHQAMDWSLVLVSQGIESVIDQDAVGGQWRLLVPDSELPRAVDAIERYRQENRRDTWRRELPWTGLVFDWRGVVVLLVFVLIYLVEVTGHGDLRALGMMNGVAVKGGEWWRLVTAVTLHGDLAHLAANVSTGLLLFGLATGVYGPGLGLLISLLAGVAGNLVGLAFYPESYRGLGASGMVMGSLGLLSAQSVILLRHGLTHRQLAVRGVLSGCLLLVLLGFSPERNTDVLAHVAGFLAGAILGAVAGVVRGTWQRRGWVNRLALFLTAALIVVPWALALRWGRPL